MCDLEQPPKVTKVLHDIMHMFCFVDVVFNVEPKAFSFRTEDFVIFRSDLARQHLRKKKKSNILLCELSSCHKAIRANEKRWHCEALFIVSS